MLVFFFAATGANELWDKLKDNFFYLVKVEDSISIKAIFSKINIDYKVTTKFKLTDILKFDPMCLTSSDSTAADQLLTLFSDLPTLQCSSSNLESSIFPEVVHRILAPLSRDVIVEKCYQSAFSGSASITASFLGIGHVDTWHGQPDCRLRGRLFEDLDITHVNHVFDSDGSGTEGDSMVVEAKKDIKRCNMPQLISLTVISSFVENNLHGDLNPLVPSLMINSSLIVVCLYDCVNDYLLLSDDISLYDMEEESQIISKSTLLLIWILINHR